MSDDHIKTDPFGRLIITTPAPKLFSIRLYEGTPEGVVYDMAKKIGVGVSPTFRGIIRTHQTVCDYIYNIASAPKQQMYDEAIQTLSIMESVVNSMEADTRLKDKVYNILQKRKHPLSQFIKEVDILEFIMLVHRSKLAAANLQR